MVDWSARNAPSSPSPVADAIWVGELVRGGVAGETYHRTRASATRHVRDRLGAYTAAGRRVLVGFDVPFGYPAGLAAALALEGSPPWRAVWDLLAGAVTDDERNRSNRFAVAAEINRRLGGGPGPFWGRPATGAPAGLTATRRDLFEFPFVAHGFALDRLRLTERATPGVQETWKLMYAGSVGSQALLGIPRVRSLRGDPALAPVSAVWPFETGFTRTPVGAGRPFVLYAEIWPGITGSADLEAEMSSGGAVKDQAQVRLMCRWAAERDDAGSLGGCFDVPPALDRSGLLVAASEEGWILA